MLAKYVTKFSKTDLPRKLSLGRLAGTGVPTDSKARPQPWHMTVKIPLKHSGVLQMLRTKQPHCRQPIPPAFRRRAVGPAPRPLAPRIREAEMHRQGPQAILQIPLIPLLATPWGRLRFKKETDIHFSFWVGVPNKWRGGVPGAGEKKEPLAPHQRGFRDGGPASWQPDPGGTPKMSNIGQKAKIQPEVGIFQPKSGETKNMQFWAISPFFQKSSCSENVFGQPGFPRLPDSVEPRGGRGCILVRLPAGKRGAVWTLAGG